MPRFDETGPFGTGPAGRGFGPCGGGLARRGKDLGFFHGGYGRGMGFFSASRPAEKEVLEQQKKWLENRLAAINQRLQDSPEKKED